MCVCVLMYTELTSPLWGFSEPMKQSTEMNKLKRLRIPNSGRSISWLYASAAEELTTDNLEQIQLMVKAGLELRISSNNTIGTFSVQTC